MSLLNVLVGAANKRPAAPPVRKQTMGAFIKVARVHSSLYGLIDQLPPERRNIFTYRYNG